MVVENRSAARIVFAIAALLEAQGANPYRVRAYRRAALGLLHMPESAAQFTGDDGELHLPGLGPRLRRKLGELISRGRMQFHQDLLAELSAAERALLTVPGIGPKTARRLAEELEIRDVTELAQAARQGRLRTLRGIGPRREQRLAEAAEHLLHEAA